MAPLDEVRTAATERAFLDDLHRRRFDGIRRDYGPEDREEAPQP